MESTLRALQSPRRRELLRLVWGAEVSAGILAESMRGITFGAVSQHLRLLKEAGLVDVRRDGRYRYYRANRDAVGVLRPWLESMWDSSIHRLDACTR